MKFDTLNDVPEEIKEFYVERTVSEVVLSEGGEPTYAQESYTYLDDDGEEQAGVRSVPIYQDVTYLDELSLNQSVSWEKVTEIIAKHAGKADDIVRAFINMAIQTELYGFKGEYLSWCDNNAEVDLHNATPQYDEEGNAIEFTPREYEAEPIRPSTECDQWMIDNYDLLRKAAYGSVISQLEMQVDGTWMDHVIAVKKQYPKPE